MTSRRRSAATLSGVGLAVLALFSIKLAASVGAAPAAPTSIAYLPVILVPPAPTPTGTPPPVTPPAATDWKTVLNYYRASARLPPLVENTGWSDGAFDHARYMVKNEVLAYTEDPATPWYSPEGATEAAKSNLMLSDNATTSDQQALDFWMQKPFHALGLLDPALLSTGFGSFTAPGGPDPYRMGAVVDVRQGLGAIPGAVRFPIKWPDHNTTVYLTSYDGNEQPDPLTVCGYGPPTGLPIILQLGPGGSSVHVTDDSFKQGNTSLTVCEFDETNYTNPTPALQILGRQILTDSDAVVLIPQQPLTSGLSYTASITANGQKVTWTFHVAP